MWRWYYYNPYQAKIWQLNNVRNKALGVGTRKLKLRLNKLWKWKDIYWREVDKDVMIDAQIYRLLLELEDKNIQAKKYRWDYREKAYEAKDKIMIELVLLLDSSKYKHDRWFAYDKMLNMWVLYVDLFYQNEVHQVSWHISDYTWLKWPVLKREYKKNVRKKKNNYEIKRERIYKFNNKWFLLLLLKLKKECKNIMIKMTI